MGQPTVGYLDPRELLERLRNEHRTLRWEPLLPANGLLRWQERPMSDEESLAYLHRNWVLPDTFAQAPAGGGMKGWVVRRFRGLVFRTIQPYLHAERELVANLVRMNDSLAKRCDDLAQVITDRQIADAENQAQLAALVYDMLGEPGKDRQEASDY